MSASSWRAGKQFVRAMAPVNWKSTVCVALVLALAVAAASAEGNLRASKEEDVAAAVVPMEADAASTENGYVLTHATRAGPA